MSDYAVTRHGGWGQNISRIILNFSRSISMKGDIWFWFWFPQRVFWSLVGNGWTGRRIFFGFKKRILPPFFLFSPIGIGLVDYLRCCFFFSANAKIGLTSTQSSPSSFQKLKTLSSKNTLNVSLLPKPWLNIYLSIVVGFFLSWSTLVGIKSDISSHDNWSAFVDFWSSISPSRLDRRHKDSTALMMITFELKLICDQKAW